MSADQSSQSSQSHPSLIGGHAKYIQGAISSTLGWTSSGEKTKSEAVEEMREAKQISEHQNPGQGPTQNGILGQIEKTAGDLTGCEGMSEEGATRIPRGSEEGSGTG